MKVVIMAGGKGTRISSISPDIPKPMININGKPVLEWQIETLQKQGFNDIILTVCYMSDAIINYFGDGQSFGVHIEYYIEKEPLGNAGALFKIKDKLVDDFLLLNADLVFDVDLNRFVNYHKAKGGLVTLFTHPNSHPYDSGLIFVDENKSVTRWLSKEDKRPCWYKNRVNAGLHIVSPKIFEKNIISKKIDLDKQLLKPLAGTGKMFCYDSPEYVKDMGTPERYRIVCNELNRNIPSKKNLKNKQKAIFLDRDGTLNKYVGFLKKISDFELIGDVSESIQLINSSEYLAIVVTNQPVIARGEVDFKELFEIHNKLETLLGLNGAFIDGIYFCPHHPDKGFVGERAEYKIECDCRKPKPGMLIKACKDFNIDLTKSWMIGDEITDVLTGKNAGCRTILLANKSADKFEQANARKINLLDAVKYILEVSSNE